jgi:cytochrome P450 StaP
MTQIEVPSAQSAEDRFEPNDPALRVDPYPIYSKYRITDPVHWGRSSNPLLAGTWYTFRYDDCSALLSDARLKNDPDSVGMAHVVPEEFEAVAKIFGKELGCLDPPQHTKVRSLMSRAFTPRRIQEFAPRMDQLANETLTKALLAGGSFDLVTEYTFPLPMTIIGDMLGVPMEDRDQFRELSVAFARAIDDPGDPVGARAGSAAALELIDYFERFVDLRRRDPQDDLISAMVAANDESGLMTEFELVVIAIELVVAGQESTVNTVTKAVCKMLQSGNYGELAQSPTRIDAAAIEEILRWTTPVQRLRERWVVEPMVVGDKEFAVGDSVVVLLGAANHDPETFPDPDRLDFARPVTRHLTFGYGRHFCLGAALARLEVNSAIRTLMTVAPNLHLTGGEVEWRLNNFIPGPSSLMVEG